MNFEFLKDLNGLNRAYKPCSEAESMINSHPDSSVLQARKGAELLAKFVYMAAHAEELQNLNFAEILADPQVYNFINDERIMSAFHFIRKNGNRAVHSDWEPSPRQATNVLKSLHLVAGETARKMELVSSYPSFNENFAGDTDAKLSSSTDIELSKEAMQAFVEYIKHTSMQNIEDSRHLVKFDPLNPAHKTFLLHGKVESHEHIAFDHQPYYQATLETLYRYVAFLDNVSYDSSDLSPADPGFVSVRGSMTIDNEVAFPLGRIDSLCKMMKERLPTAKSFSIDLYIDGDMRQWYDDPTSLFNRFDENDPWQGNGLVNQMEALKRRESFTYKAAFYYGEDGCSTDFILIQNGKTYDVETLCKPDLSALTSCETLRTEGFTIYVDCDHQALAALKEPLRDAAREYLPPDERDYIESLWAEEDEDNTFGYVLAGIFFVKDADLSKTQRFADRVNEILAPVADQCCIYTDYNIVSTPPTQTPPSEPSLSHCLYNQENFCIAALVWRDNKLQLVGTKL